MGFLKLGLVKYFLPTYSGQENVNLHPDSPNPASQIPRLTIIERPTEPQLPILEQMGVSQMRLASYGQKDRIYHLSSSIRSTYK